MAHLKRNAIASQQTDQPASRIAAKLMMVPVMLSQRGFSQYQQVAKAGKAVEVLEHALIRDLEQLKTGHRFTFSPADYRPREVERACGR